MTALMCRRPSVAPYDHLAGNHQ